LLINLIIIFFLFIIWAFFAGSETAFISSSKLKLRNLKRTGKKTASIAFFLLEKPERLLTTSLVGTNISLVLSANLTALIVTQVFGKPRPVVSVIIITLLSLIICEIIPKNMGIKHSLKLTLISSIPMYVFYIIFFPLVKIFSFLSMILIRLTGTNYTGIGPSIFSKKEDVKIFLKSSLKGKFTGEHTRYFIDSLDFGTKTLSEVMIPLVEMRALREESKVEDCYRYIQSYKKDYIPLYKQRIDNITGVVYINDLMGVPKSKPVLELKKEPVFVPESKNISELYRELRKKDIPVVFAVDEHGGVTGTATIYDIGEEITGKISTLDNRKNLFIKIKEGEYLCDGNIEIDDINHNLSINIQPLDFTTLNGFLLKEIGRIPRKGEYIDRAGYRFIVEKGSSRRIELIRIIKSSI